MRSDAARPVTCSLPNSLRPGASVGRHAVSAAVEKTSIGTNPWPSQGTNSKTVRESSTLSVA